MDQKNEDSKSNNGPTTSYPWTLIVIPKREQKKMNDRNIYYVMGQISHQTSNPVVNSFIFIIFPTSHTLKTISVSNTTNLFKYALKPQPNSSQNQKKIVFSPVTQDFVTNSNLGKK